MTSNITIITEMKTRDAIASSAFHCLVHDLAYNNRIVKLERRECWRIELDLPDLAARMELGRRLAEETKLFVNPNKHLYTVRTSPPESIIRTGASESSIVHVIVTEREDSAGKGALNQLRSLYRIDRHIDSISFGFLYTLIFAPGVADPMGLAAEIAQLTDRAHGLLCNPHSQMFEVF